MFLLWVKLSEHTHVVVDFAFFSCTLLLLFFFFNFGTMNYSTCTYEKKSLKLISRCSSSNPFFFFVTLLKKSPRSITKSFRFWRSSSFWLYIRSTFSLSAVHTHIKYIHIGTLVTRFLADSKFSLNTLKHTPSVYAHPNNFLTQFLIIIIFTLLMRGIRFLKLHVSKNFLSFVIPFWFKVEPFR